jgi:hypothetical protein
LQPAGRWLPESLHVDLDQRTVDFVIPRLDADLRLCIDPFLLYKNKREDLRSAHRLLLSMFEEAFQAFRGGRDDRARQLVSFPEAREIGFGYARDSTRGRGVGPALGDLVVDVIRESPALVNRGLRHVEELQLLSVGIAEDRISDVAANVLRRFLIEYTQKQSELWRIPLTSGVPVEHIWDPEEAGWVDGYFDLPTDPVGGRPLLLVPRWIVRRLPWINYGDYLKSDLRNFLGAKLRGSSRRQIPKPRAVAISRRNLELVDDYVDRKEQSAHLAQPEPPPLLSQARDPVCADLLAKLDTMATGLAQAYEYQRLVLELLNCLLEPELVDGDVAVRTASGVEIRDVVYTNNSELPFLDFIRNHHGNLLLVFECKNVRAVDQDDINQLANYLGDAMGYVGFIVTRNPASDAMLAKARATFNKRSERVVLLFLNDDDFHQMADMKRAGRSPVDLLQRRYRELMQSVE